LALRGVLVRHLVMPGLLEDTREIMRWLAMALSRDTYVNVMDNYPAHKGTEPRFAQIIARLARRFKKPRGARSAGLY
jgi:putative pyruvate formate lyase activating enzyme